eukprot:TRINITY_DN2084_c0_g2_i1.p1 TRINITY_DN2084_c0_g2~~TRINITY_DN2084_c0_g2_i1.p1  ORF type:complete len:157 (+),score=29.70 TRINITY_DN2084_c0_g2_i1:24-494(+)
MEETYNVDTTLEQDIPNDSIIVITAGNLKIFGNVGDRVTITSNQKIIIKGHVGNNCRLVAVEQIEVQDVGSGTDIRSETSKVTGHQIGTKVHIESYNDIILGSVDQDSDIICHNGNVKIGVNHGANVVVERPGKALKIEPKILGKMLGDSNRRMLS